MEILLGLPPSCNGSVLSLHGTHASMISRPREESAGRPVASLKKKKKISLLESITSVQILLTEINHLPSLNSKGQRHATLPVWQEKRELEIFMRSNIPLSIYLTSMRKVSILISGHLF